MTVEPVMSPAGVRPLDLAIAGEPFLEVGAELLDVVELDFRRRETADEELEEERLARAGDDRLEPGVECAAPVACDAVQLLVGPRRLADQSALGEALIDEPGQRGVQPAARRRPDMRARLRHELREVVAGPLPVDGE